MTSSLKAGEDAARLSRSQPSEQKIDTSDPITAALGNHGALIRTRRGQSLSLAVDAAETLYIVRSGTLMLRVTLPEGVRQVVTLFHPGDMFRAGSAPPFASARLTAVSPGDVLRLRWDTFCDLAADDPELTRIYDNAAAKQNAHDAVHMATIGQLDCQQRVATFLLELALRTGVRAPCGGLDFEIPLNRTDIADYLGLNADTLSRTMSRLRGSGVVSHPERHRGLVRDLEKLAALTPAAKPLRALYGNGPA